MLSKKLSAALNEQMNNELYSAYFYLGARSYFEEQELPGFANFFQIQSAEELTHAMKVFDYLHRVGAKANLQAIAAPKLTYQSVLEAFEDALANERKLAKEIGALLDLAATEKHAPPQIFMQWFVTEQVEEESLFVRCISRIKRAGQDGQGLLILDQEMGRRAAEPAKGGE